MLNDVVGVLQHRAEQPVDLGRRDGVQREPPVEVDVAEMVDGERDAVHLQVALEQPAVDRGVVLVGVPGRRTRAPETDCAPTVERTVVFSLRSPGRSAAKTPGSLSVNSSSFSVRTLADHVRRRRSSPSRPPRRSRRAIVRAAVRVRRQRLARRSAPSRTAGRARPPPGRSSRAVSGSRRDPAQRVGKSSARARATSSPVCPSAHRRTQAADRRGDHRRTAGLRLQRDQPEGLACTTGRRPRSAARYQSGQLGLRHRLHEPDHVVDPERPGQLGERLGVLQAGARRTADDRDDQPVPQRRVALEHRARPRAAARRAPSAAGSGRRRAARRRPAAARGGAGPRPDHPGGRRPGRRPGGPPRPSRGRRRTASISSLRLLVGVGDEPVGGLDHLLLADHAGRRLGVSPSARRRS